jgi:hypothetical protein
MENSMPSELNEEAAMLLRTPEIQKLFRNYDNLPPRRTMPVKLQSQTNSLNTSTKFAKKIL